MFFITSKLGLKKGLLIIGSSISLSLTISAISATKDQLVTKDFTLQTVDKLITHSIPDNQLQISATPEVVAELNHAQHTVAVQQNFQGELSRMQPDQAFILSALKSQHMPADYLAIPMVESGFKPLVATKSAHGTAGIWQMLPSTARNYGLTVSGKRDDRLNDQLETTAALSYLNYLYAEFHDWRLALVAYDQGDMQTQHLIKVTGALDPWILARSHAASAELKQYLTMIDASVLIIHNPKLVQTN